MLMSTGLHGKMTPVLPIRSYLIWLVHLHKLQLIIIVGLGLGRWVVWVDAGGVIQCFLTFPTTLPIATHQNLRSSIPLAPGHRSISIMSIIYLRWGCRGWGVINTPMWFLNTQIQISKPVISPMSLFDYLIRDVGIVYIVRICGCISSCCISIRRLCITCFIPIVIIQHMNHL